MDFQRGRSFIVAGFLISLLYYTVVFGAPLFAYGAFLVWKSEVTMRRKLMWILIPAILWWPVVFSLMYILYSLNSM
jgi:hypothetical protein